MSGAAAVAEPAVTGIARSRAYRGVPLFANGFRPFFLLGAIQAGLSILVWLPLILRRAEARIGIRAARLARA